jgi:excisionase family DNA binding protein
MPSTRFEKQRNRCDSTVCRVEEVMDPNAERPRTEYDPPMERLLTVEEVARILHVSPGWVYDHVDRKRPRIQSVRLGRLVRFLAEDVQKFIEAMMQRIA